MDRNPTAHAAHDELLLARLYGGDLDGRELERARETAATCAGCAAAFADFGAIAAATAALPVPPRPRDFTIDATLARKLRRGRARPMGLRAILGRLGPVRSLGASMAAAGVAGILAFGALSVFGPTGSGTATVRQADGPVTAEGGSAASNQPLGGPEASHYYGPEPTKAGVETADSAPPKDVSASHSNDPVAASSVPDGNFGSQGGKGTNGGQPPTSPESGPPWPLLFGGLAAGGLILLAAPAAGRRFLAGRR